MLEVETLRFWHGTTAAAAQRVVAEGFAHFNPDAEVKFVSERYGVSPGDLREACTASYALTRRPAEISVAEHPLLALQYAGRDGGEARFELLVGVWRLRHGGEPDVAAEEAWARSELVAEPGLVSVDVPFDLAEAHLRRLNWQEEPWTLETYLPHRAFPDVDIALPLPVPVEWCRQAEADRVLHDSDVASLLGVRTSLVWDWIEAGTIPAPESPAFSGKIWRAETLRPWLAERGVNL